MGIYSRGEVNINLMVICDQLKLTSAINLRNAAHLNIFPTIEYIMGDSFRIIQPGHFFFLHYQELFKEELLHSIWNWEVSSFKRHLFLKEPVDVVISADWWC